MDGDDIDDRWPRIITLVGGGHGEAALLPMGATPVIDQLVAGHPDEPPPTVGAGVVPRLSASTAAMNVSAARSSASSTPPQWGSR
jgi:hypothetical protein